MSYDGIGETSGAGIESGIESSSGIRIVPVTETPRSKSKIIQKKRNVFLKYLLLGYCTISILFTTTTHPFGKRLPSLGLGFGLGVVADSRPGQGSGTGSGASNYQRRYGNTNGNTNGNPNTNKNESIVSPTRPMDSFSSSHHETAC